MAPSSFKKGQRGYPDFETMSGPHYPYMQPGSSSSTPAWDFTSNDPHHTSGTYDPPRQSGHLVLEDEDEPKEWMAQVEPGVQITFVSLPDGGNDLKRIRFKEWNRNYGVNQHYNAGPSSYGTGGFKGEGSSMEASRTTTSSRDEPSVSVSSDMESEWVEQDEPGVYITIRQLTDGTRELRRVRFR
ncbi:hypothetical protein E3N88_45961 [Mikania micrantha]|uniref:BRX domain-containing protein n=1 Tax=Mikania micrantha TaxID=192012 RepID=A0A5N6L7Y8_9ASTR|nr:hypothetical protein E3N88_45961 [Mikania micrantha]